MGEQSAARIGGDDYQHLYSWYLLLQLLSEESLFDHAYVEHPKAGAADDVTLHPKNPIKVAARYYQVKWHVSAAGEYGFEFFAKVNKPSTKSLIEKLFTSWKELTNTGDAEIWLVSNWPAAADLRGFIRESYDLHQDFHTKGPRTNVGKCKKLWCTTLKADDATLTEFCRQLRLRLGFGSIKDLEEAVDDRMSANGLKSGLQPRRIILGAIRDLIKTGGPKKRVSRQSLIELITENQLWAEAADSPKAGLTIHGWTKETFDRDPTIELDWTKYIDRDTRRIPSQDEWMNSLLPQLKAAKTKFLGISDGRYIDFRGKLPLTFVLAIGAAFPDVGGFAFRTLQPTGSENNLWRSDTAPTKAKFTREPLDGSTPGDDVVLFLSVSGNGRTDAERFFNENRDKFSAIVYAEPQGGGGQAALKGAGDAVALANHAKELIREGRTKYAATRIHLVLYGPASFSLFLGQKLNAVGPIVTYERTAEGGYQESITIATG